MVTRLLGLTMAASLIEAYCCQLDLLIQVSSHCGLQKLTRNLIMAIYNISKCQCTAEQNVAQETIMAIYNCIYLQQLHISIPYPSVNAQKDTQKIIITMVDQ